jgi:hypothetical protein
VTAWYGTVRVLTWLDLAICAALATPPTAALTFALLNGASAVIGGTPVDLPQGTGAFFVNLAGLFGVLWNIVMLNSAEPRWHRIDLVARLGVIGLILFHIARSGLPLIFLLFVLTELVGGAAKLVWMRKAGPCMPVD